MVTLVKTVEIPEDGLFILSGDSLEIAGHSLVKDRDELSMVTVEVSQDICLFKPIEVSLEDGLRGQATWW